MIQMKYDKNKIAYIFQTSKTIAVVGLSAKPDRASNQVAKYLIQHGFDVIPVNPGSEEILGKTCYPSLFDIPIQVQIVNIFRRSDLVPEIVRAAIQIEVPYIWMQEGITNEAAAQQAREHKIAVIEDLCIKKMHQKFQVGELL